MTTTSVGMRCPECAGQTTTVRRIAAQRADEPMLTYVLIGVIVLVQLGSLAGGANATGQELGGSTLIADGAVSRDTVADGELWRLVTSGFLHAGLLHLMFNAYALYVLGSMLEPAIGRARFAMIYFVSLLGGSFGALLFSFNSPTVGASGAAFGLLVAGILLMRARGIDPMQSGLVMTLVLNLGITFLIPGISIGGHLGGIVAGGIASVLLFELGARRRAMRDVALAATAALGVALAVACVVYSRSKLGV